MALDKDILGQALYDMRNNFFNNQTLAQLEATYGTIESARLEGCKKEAEVIIDHFKNNAVLHVPGAGLTAGATAVTGQSNTGTLT
jgi:hypothetical protein